MSDFFTLRGIPQVAAAARAIGSQSIAVKLGFIRFTNNEVPLPSPAAAG